MGIEPTSSAWKAEVLPLNYTRFVSLPIADLKRSRLPDRFSPDCPLSQRNNSKATNKRAGDTIPAYGSGSLLEYKLLAERDVYSRRFPRLAAPHLPCLTN